MQPRIQEQHAPPPTQRSLTLKALSATNTSMPSPSPHTADMLCSVGVDAHLRSPPPPAPGGVDGGDLWSHCSPNQEPQPSVALPLQLASGWVPILPSRCSRAALEAGAAIKDKECVSADRRWPRKRWSRRLQEGSGGRCSKSTLIVSPCHHATLIRRNQEEACEAAASQPTMEASMGGVPPKAPLTHRHHTMAV